MYLGFWAVVFVLNVGPEWQRYSSAREVLEVAGTVTALQFAVAAVAIRWFVPLLLERGRTVLFAALLLLTLLGAAELNILISYFYLEPTYPESYGRYYLSLEQKTLIERLGFSSIIKYILFSKLPLLSFPTAVLIAGDFYRKQQKMLQLREQKRAAELNALKNQLNPHFIFNTLNNIYALALKQSDQTAEAVAKLSGILDYVLYRCNAKYVSLADEVAMIEDYVALEEIRFGERLDVTFSNDVSEPVQIAPLLLLTLLENAFKHSVSQQLERARVSLSLTTDDRFVVFVVENTRPRRTLTNTGESNSIGLANLRRQLDLLYPQSHSLSVDAGEAHHRVRLALDKGIT
ncbi:MAG: sensor histidine kinase [Pseudomonadota bacterium]